MTYCIGFKSKTAVFLIADTMITSGRNAEIENLYGAYTTFGEFVEDEDYTMQDKMVKVLKLHGNVLVTFAGFVATSLEVIGILQRELKTGMNPVVAFERVISSGPFSDVELLIGFIEKGNAKLYSYNYMNNGKFKEEHSVICLGSGKEHEYFSNQTSKLVDGLATNNKISNEKTLVFTLAFLQNFTIKIPLTTYGVGGFFYGGYVHNEGIQMVWNTTYLMYAVTQKNEQKSLRLNYQVSLNRNDNLLLVSSSFLDHHRIYLQEIFPEDTPTLKDLENQVNNLKDDYWNANFELIVLLNQFNYGFAVCFMKNKNKNSEVKILPNRTKEEVTIRLSSSLQNYLLNLPSLKEKDIDPIWDRNDPAHIEIPIRWFS